MECELLARRSFKNRAEARLAVFDFIEGFYNTHRRHSALGYVSPAEFERDGCRMSFGQHWHHDCMREDVKSDDGDTSDTSDDDGNATTRRRS